MKLAKSRSPLEAAADDLIRALQEGCERPIAQSIAALRRIAAIEIADAAAQDAVAGEIRKVTVQLRRDTGHGSPWAVLPDKLWEVETNLAHRNEGAKR